MGKIVELVQKFEEQDNGDYKLLDTVCEIIRCRDCEYFDDVGETNSAWNCLHRKGMVDPEGNDFCSVGERKHGKENS